MTGVELSRRADTLADLQRSPGQLEVAAFDGEDVGFGRLGSESEDVASAVGVRVDRQFPDGLILLELHVDAFVIRRDRGVVGRVVGVAEEAGGGEPVGGRLPGSPRAARGADPGEIRRDRRPAGQADQQRGPTERGASEDGIAWAKPPQKEKGSHPPHEVRRQSTGTQGSGQGRDAGKLNNPPRRSSSSEPLQKQGAAPGGIHRCSARSLPATVERG